MADFKKSLRALRSMAIVSGIVVTAVPLSACFLNPCAARSRNSCAPRAANPCGPKLAGGNPCAPTRNPCAPTSNPCSPAQGSH